MDKTKEQKKTMDNDFNNMLLVLDNSQLPHFQKYVESVHKYHMLILEDFGNDIGKGLKKH